MKEILKVCRYYGVKSMVLGTLGLMGCVGVGYMALLIICDIVKYSI